MGIVVPLPPPPRPKSDPDPNQPPPFETPSEDYAAKLREFLDRKAPYDHPLRLRQHSTWRQSDLYLASQQWLRPSYNLDPVHTPHWSRIVFNENDPDQIPMPTFNEMIGVVRNEAARLGRPEYKPYVRPMGENPDAKTKAAAIFAAEILLAELDAMNWEEQTALGFHHLPAYGGWTLKSWWDVSYENTTRIPKLTAKKCPAPGCEFKVADSALTFEQSLAVNQFKPGRVTSTPAPDGDMDKATFGMDVCLTCDDHEETTTEDVPALDEMGQPMLGPDGAFIMTPVETSTRVPGPPELEPYVPVAEELYDHDSFGRDLGQDIPVGQWKCATRSPYDMFWAELGVGEDPQNWKEIQEIHVESLDWVRARFPDKADKVKAESREALLKWHPIGGERELFYAQTTADGLLKNHVRIKEYHKKPYMEYDPKQGKWALNKGRSIIMAGNCVLLDGPFLIESKNNPGTFIPRVHYDYVPFDIRDGGYQMHGVSLCEYLFDAQDAINEGASQTQDTRQRMGVPGWLATRGMNLDYAKSGGAGYVWQWDTDPNNPSAKPKEVGSTTISPGVAGEGERVLDYIARVGNTREVEQGSVPPGVTAAAAIQIMAEQAGEQRRPRITRIRKMFERVWKHGLMLLHEFVREPRLYHKKDETDDWRQKSWTGLDLMGQSDVRIDPEPEHDTVLQKRENMVKAVEMGVLNPQGNKKAAMLIAKGLEVPNDLTEDDDMQYDHANREFLEYLDHGLEPVVDDGLDDDVAHNDQHGQDCLTERWKQKELQAGWREILKLIDGWNEPLGVDPMTGAPQTLMSMLESQPMGVDPLSGEPITRGAQWPALLELKIMECWKVLAEKHIASNPQKQQVILEVMRFRAHKASHEMRLEQQAQAAQAGAQMAAAPGTDATAAGTAPAPGMLVQ